jgi:tetratricopeptide (TPR) repeat protein
MRIVTVIFLAAAMSARAAYVELSNGTRIEGTDIRAKSDGEIILTTAQGIRSFMKGQYTAAFADKPADFDKAKGLAAQKNYDEAARILADVAARYRFLGWDNQANALLAQVYIAKGDAAAAAGCYEQMFRNSPETAADGNLQWGYRAALLGAKQYDKLNPLLTESIAKGSRADAARAQTMRGDIKLAQNQTEGAFLDYMRTVTLFENEREVRPEAMLKAAEALEKLRDPRAKDLYKQLRETYPDSPFAQKAAGK